MILDSRNNIKEKGAIKEAVIKHFKEIYKAQDTLNTAEQVKIADYYPKMFKEEDSTTLFQPVSLEELKNVLFKFKKEKSLGPDGWSIELYLHFFDLMCQDLLDVVEDARTRGVVKT